VMRRILGRVSGFPCAASEAAMRKIEDTRGRNTVQIFGMGFSALEGYGLNRGHRFL
jgi:hypothetical protein